MSETDGELDEVPRVRGKEVPADEKTVRLVVLGSGDAMGTGGRHAPSFLLTSGATHLLVDCGPSALPSLKARGLAVTEMKGILISHFHGDHFGGIPYIFLDFQFLSERSEPILLIGPKGLRERVEGLMRALYPDVTKAHSWSFDQQYREMVPNEVFEQADLKIEAFQMAHNAQGAALGYRIHWHGAVLGYTGDTRWNDQIPELANGCDLFLCECFSFHRNQDIHICHQDLVDHRSEIRAGRTLLFHLGPDMFENLSRLEFEAAEDGMVIDL